MAVGASGTEYTRVFGSWSDCCGRILLICASKYSSVWYSYMHSIRASSIITALKAGFRVVLGTPGGVPRPLRRAIRLHLRCSINRCVIYQDIRCVPARSAPRAFLMCVVLCGPHMLRTIVVWAVIAARCGRRCPRNTINPGIRPLVRLPWPYLAHMCIQI